MGINSAREHHTLSVELGARSYPILISSGCIDKLSEKKIDLQKDGRKTVALVDENLISSNPSLLEPFLSDIPFLKVPSGENSKSSKWLCEGWDFLASNKVDRTGMLFVIGGGVTGDLGGFLAASYLRGIEFIQVPTTLLAMVDSSVGGKTGINISAGKNLVGAFHQPSNVFIDLEFLQTLPKREFSAGMAEVIKYGLLGNVTLYDKIFQLQDVLSPTHTELPNIIRQCCLDKARIVSEDEKESASQGGRALLNLGHTFAHAIEAVAGYGNYLHGEAVAIGLVCAMRLSRMMGFCENESEEGIIELLRKYELPVELTKPLPAKSLLDSMMNDKKVKKGTLRFILMKEIGCSFVDASVDLNLVSETFKTVGAHQ